ncbi:MAG TPA: translation initiation factor IF-1 [Candidatus Paceibacterota bacterium]
MATEDKRINPVPGTIIEALPNATFRVELESGDTCIAYLSGKMRLNRIRVLIGDSVLLELDDYGKRGRIVRRS